MVRSVYSWVLRLHPPFFRERFAQEMLAIFDAEESPLSRVRLLADGIFSLLRQWLLRPEFWAAPDQQPAPNGAPLFYVVRRFTPRLGALIDGGLVSIVTFTAVCLMMQYTWEHPTLMPIVSYYRAAQKTAQSAHANAQQTAERRPVPPVYVDGGRVILMVQNPSRAAGRK